MEGPSGLFDFNDETDDLLDTRADGEANSAPQEREAATESASQEREVATSPASVAATPPGKDEPETAELDSDSGFGSESDAERPPAAAAVEDRPAAERSRRRSEGDGRGVAPQCEGERPRRKSAGDVPDGDEIPRRKSSIEDVVHAAKIAAKANSEGDAEFVCSDEHGYVRGPCRACAYCPLYVLAHRMEVTWWRTPGGSTQQGALQELSACQHCGCRAEDHENCTRWLVDVRNSLRRFRSTHINTTRPLPQRSRVPAAALAWPADDVALHALTLGKFDPWTAHWPKDVRRGDEDKVKPGIGVCRGSLVSVCVPTTDAREIFHILVYRNFIAQSYEPKELVVVETGRRPSKYMQERALVDPRVLHRFFPADDAVGDSGEPALQRLLFKPGVGGGSNAFQPRAVEGTMKGIPRDWALGMKRNIACNLARGDIIVHFDDDDLYSPMYIENMVGHLQAAVDRAGKRREAPSTRLPPAIATLSQWHMMDMPDMIFRLMDPKKDPDVKPEWVEPMIYGYGFSYVYTKAAWELQAFPDTQTCEDDIFMRSLREKQVPVELVQLPLLEGGKGPREREREGYVAHVLHGDCTSGGEFNGNKRLGPVVAAPATLQDILIYATRVSRHLPRKIAGVPQRPTTAASLKGQGGGQPWPGELTRPTVATRGGKALGRGMAGRGFSLQGSRDVILGADSQSWARSRNPPPMFGAMRSRKGA